MDALLSSLKSHQIHPKSLSQNLRDLQLNELKQFGLVEKKSYAGYPLKEEYFYSIARKINLIVNKKIGNEVKFLSDRRMLIIAISP